MKSVYFIAMILCAQNLLALEESKYPAGVVPISKDHHYVHKHSAHHYWAISPYAIGQKTGSSCSVASVTMLINGIRADKKLNSSDELATEKLTLQKAQIQEWEKRTNETPALPGEFKGVPLDLLHKFIAPALAPWAIQVESVTMNHIDVSSSAEKEKWHDDLEEFENNENVWIVINFDQGVLMKDKPVGHVSPIAAYDKSTKRVLVLDPDKSWYEPYWAPEEEVFSAMATWGSEFQRNRGYLKIRIKK